MKLALFLTVASALLVVGGVYKAFNQKVEMPVTDVPTPVYDSWVHWKKNNGKSYGTNSEEDYRLKQFAENFQFISTNQKAEHTFEMDLNGFADMGLDEFVATFGGLKYGEAPQVGAEQTTLPEPENFASSQDWRGKAVTPVKNQGSCGSCWAFATTGSLEGAYAVKYNNIKSFSEQHLVDCAGTPYRNHGCQGGMMMGAFQYVIKYGIMEEKTYPYTAKAGYCQYSMKPHSHLVKVSDYAMVPPGDQNQLAYALAKQPVAVAIMATRAVQLYKGGIFNDWTCGGGINHGVLAVGYASNYFIVKNSWGASWGESGFIRFARRSTGAGICSITQVATYPHVFQG